MKRLNVLLLFFLAALAVLAFSFPACAVEPESGPASYRGKARRMKSLPGWPANLQFLSGPNGGQWFQLGEAIAQRLNRDIISTSSRLGGGLSNLESVNSKTGDFAFSVTSFLHGAEADLPEFAEVDTANIATLGEMFPQILYVLVREDFARRHNILTLRDLLNMKSAGSMASLRSGSASFFAVSLLLKYGYGTGFDQLKERGWRFTLGNFTVLSDEFVSGRIDSIIFTAGSNVALVHSLVEYVPVVFLPVDLDVVERFAEEFGMYSHVMPKMSYKNMQEDVQTIGDTTNIIIRKNLPDDLVFAITQNIYEYRHAIAENIPEFVEWKPALESRFASYLHPGARKYWLSIFPPAPDNKP